MKVLITGGAGFIGKWVIEKLPIDSEIVVIDSIDEQVHKTLADFAPEVKERATCIKDDVQNIEAYKNEIEGTEVVIHLASQTGTGQSMYEISRYVQQNVNGTAKLLELISSLNQKPNRIILSSSRAVYGEGAYTDGNNVAYPKGRELSDLQNAEWEVFGENHEKLASLKMNENHSTNPTSVYGLTKLWQEQLLSNYCDSQGIDLVTFRFQNVYGPKQELGNPYTGIIGIFTNSILQDGAVELFEDGLMTRDFIFVEDVAQAVCNCVLSTQSIYGVINIGSGWATTLKDLVISIAKIAQKDTSIKYSKRFRVGDVRHAVADMKKYEQIFGEWLPKTLDEGLSAYLDWYVNQAPIDKNELQLSLSKMADKGLLMKGKNNKKTS